MRCPVPYPWLQLQRAAARLGLVVPVALGLIFFVLFMTFGNVRQAVLVLGNVPFAMVGGIVALHVTHIELSISAAIGFIALLGQVALAGLLVVSAVEDLRRQGMPLMQALIEGAAERMRSIILVALLALLGLLPMALSTGVGSETQRPFASVIVGGVSIADACAMQISDLAEWFRQLDTAAAGLAGAEPLLTTSMKSVGVVGSGSGSQRSWFGGVGGMAWKSLTMRVFANKVNGGCWLAGRMRYSHERRFCARGAVKAVPDSCSAYRPSGERCGEFCPCGKAPAMASVANSLPKPLW